MEIKSIKIKENKRVRLQEPRDTGFGDLGGGGPDLGGGLS